jgi:uncharacterized membrane-anchored protein
MAKKTNLENTEKIEEKPKIKKLILFAALFVIIVAITITYSAWPLLTGKTYVLKTEPVDPFDIFRGQYIIIRYEIGTLENTGLTQDDVGKDIYVKLTRDQDKTWNSAGYSLAKPEGDYIRGEITSVNKENIRVEYGIEQYFFERNAEFQTNGMAVEVKVAKDGRARISRLLKDGKELEIRYSSRYN